MVISGANNRPKVDAPVLDITTGGESEEIQVSAKQGSLRNRNVTRKISTSIKLFSPKLPSLPFPSLGSLASTKSGLSSSPKTEPKLPEDAERIDYTSSENESTNQSNAIPLTWFEDDLSHVQSSGDFPEPLAGGVVVDQSYGITAKEMNALIFKPESEFYSEWTGGNFPSV